MAPKRCIQSPAPLDRWLCGVPKTEEQWKAKREEVNLSKVDSLINTFLLVARLSPDAYNATNIFDALEQYQQYASTLITQNKIVRPVSDYATLVFMCLCVVSIHSGISIKKVEEQIKKFFTTQQKECTSTSKYLSSLRTGALWALRQMDELYQTDLRHRAWEVFLISGPSIHSYRKLQTASLAEKVTVCRPPKGEPHADVSFHVPFMIMVIIGRKLSLDQINNALHTHLTHETYNEWEHALYRRMASVCLMNGPEKLLGMDDASPCTTDQARHDDARTSSQKKRLRIESLVHHWPRPITLPLSPTVPNSTNLPQRPFISTSRPSQIADSTYLLLLAHFLGGSLSEPLLQRTKSAQPRWNDDGNVEQVMPSAAGLDQQLLAILSAENRLDEALSSFDKSLDHWTISSDFPKHLTPSVQVKSIWYIKALTWVCFAFPRIRSQEPRYTFLVHSLLPPLKHILQNLKQATIPTSVKHEVAEVLLAASKIDGIRKDILPDISSYLDKESPSHLRAELAVEQSIFSRLQGDYDSSERAIHDFSCPCGSPTDECLRRIFRSLPPETNGRSNAIYGLLHRSHLENLVQCDKYTRAIDEVEDWTTRKSPSIMELSTLTSRALTACKIFRSQGNFEDARKRLEFCLTDWNDPIYPQIFCQLLDVYSDLGLSQQSAELISSQIKSWGRKNQSSKALRRFLVSSLDIDLQQRRYPEAEKNIKKLSRTFANLRHLNVSDELLHMRVLISSARISYLYSEFDQAAWKWKLALSHVQRYASFRGEGFTYAVIHLSLSLAYLVIDERDKAVKSFEQGQKILSDGKRDYWIPTLSDWLSYVNLEIKSRVGWVCQIQTF